MKAEIDEGMDENFSERLIRKIIKNDLNLSFNQCNSRPLTFNVAKTARMLFWTLFIGKFEPSTLIINVDESIFSRTSKINYSWSMKDGCVELKNTPFPG